MSDKTIGANAFWHAKLCLDDVEAALRRIRIWADMAHDIIADGSPEAIHRAKATLTQAMELAGDAMCDCERVRDLLDGLPMEPGAYSATVIVDGYGSAADDDDDNDDMG